MSHPIYPEKNVIYYNTDEMTQSFCFNGHQKNWVNDEDETHDESISRNWGIFTNVHTHVCLILEM